MSMWTRNDPADTFNAGRWVRCVAVVSIIWAAAILAIVRADAPAWEHVAGFVIVYAAGWISPPVWLVAYIAERIITSYKNGRQKVA